jgi:hypothetical protein
MGRLVVELEGVDRGTESLRAAGGDRQRLLARATRERMGQRVLQQAPDLIGISCEQRDDQSVQEREHGTLHYDSLVAHRN